MTSEIYYASGIGTTCGMHVQVNWHRLLVGMLAASCNFRRAGGSASTANWFSKALIQLVGLRLHWASHVTVVRAGEALLGGKVPAAHALRTTAALAGSSLLNSAPAVYGRLRTLRTHCCKPLALCVESTQPATSCGKQARD